jgi:hypothetical protein
MPTRFRQSAFASLVRERQLDVPLAVRTSGVVELKHEADVSIAIRQGAAAQLAISTPAMSTSPLLS